MKDIAEKLKQSFAPMVIGWVLTIWAPVPPPIRTVVNTAVDAACNGVQAVISTMRSEPSVQTAQR